MGPFPLILVLISTFMHAAWNLSAKKQRNERIFFRRMLGFVAAAGFAPAVLAEILGTPMPVKAWLCVIGSGVFCGSYFFFLARSYESSDFTVAYPIARALPVLLVGIADAARGRPPTSAAALGLLMVAAGCIFVPLESVRSIKISNYLNRGTLFMLFAAGGTVGYSVLDKIASEAVAPGPVSAIRYGYFFYLFAFLAYIAYPVRVITHENHVGPRRIPLICGAVCFVSYSLILWAYQLTMHASYVVAFRQFSIIIGVIAGLLIFKERGLAVRIAGTLLLTAGLVLIAAGG